MYTVYRNRGNCIFSQANIIMIGSDKLRDVLKMISVIEAEIIFLNFGKIMEKMQDFH